jgi:chemotaxis protein MotB
LFIILYAISNVDSAKYDKMTTALGSVFGSTKFKIETNIPITKFNERSVVPMDFLKQELSEIININELNNSVSIENNQRGITVRILDDVLFPSGEAELKSKAQEVLKLVAEVIKKLPNDIRVEGHTDNIAINSTKYPSNWHLSIARALNAAYHLIQAEKIDPDRVSVVGYSEYNPIADNSTSEGRAKNRRVDIIVIKSVE